MAKQNKPSLGTTIRQSSSGVLAALMCIVIGLVIGLIALFIINPEHALVDGFWRILQGGFYDFPYGCGKVLTQTAPLIMTGLSVAFAFKTGLFNIGAAGQYTLGAFGALYFAIVLGMPWWVCLLVSAVFGAVWGAIPGIFKAYLNINEVITSIMFNWIGLYLVNEIIYGRGSGVMYDAHNTRTWKLATNAPQAQIPSCGMSELFHTSNTTIAIFLAIIVAIVVWVVLEKTTFGYELKAVGLNKNAARYAGINEKKNVILSMTIAGALAGFGAGLFYLSGGGEWNPLNSTSLPAMGFNGIATALLANSNPIGTIFSSLFISHISVGGAYLPTKYFPSEIADLISGIIIYLCAFSMLFRTLFEKKLIQKKDTANANAEPAAKAVTKPEKEGKSYAAAYQIHPAVWHCSDAGCPWRHVQRAFRRNQHRAGRHHGCRRPGRRAGYRIAAHHHGPGAHRSGCRCGSSGLRHALFAAAGVCFHQLKSRPDHRRHGAKHAGNRHCHDSGQAL